MADKLIYLTLEGKQKLEQELDFLVNVRRRQVATAIQLAKEMGDISDNAGYDEAKLHQGFVEGRIQTIAAQLRQAIIIKKNDQANKVQLGGKVTVEEEGFGKETYQIVGSAESDPTAGKISNECPIGKALLGAKVGDLVTAKTPNGEVAFKVVQIA